MTKTIMRQIRILLLKLQTTEPITAGPATTLADGLVIQDEVVGTGATAVAGDNVTVNYVGTLQDGTKFDSSIDRGVPFSIYSWSGTGHKGMG